MFQSLKTVFALASLTSAAAFYDNVIEERQTACATGLHLMIGGGCAIPCSSDVPSLLSTLISNITYAFPGTDQYFVPYNGDMHQAQNSTVYMIAEFNSYVQRCPQTPIVFIGYSLGGIVTMNTLCGGVSASYAPNVIAAITYGEETFRNGLSYDAGTCTQPAPNYPRNNTDQCAPYAAAIQDYCDATDPNCCKGGLDPNSHFTYPTFYDIKALDFIKSRYAALASTSSTASSSTVRSTSTSTSTGTVTVSTTVSATPTTTASTMVSTTASTVVSTTASTQASTVTSGSTASSASSAASVSTATVKSSTATISPSSSSTASASASAPASASISSVPHYSIPVASSTVAASVSTFPDIPNSVILVPSSVYASYLSTIVTTVAKPTGSASTAGAITAAASASGVTSSHATATSPAVATYTGAAPRQFVPGALGLAAGLAAYIVA